MSKLKLFRICLILTKLMLKLVTELFGYNTTKLTDKT